MSDFFSQFAATQANDLFERERPYERNFIERLFAPIQAPQEALLTFTLETGDGFQIQDIWKAVSQGARYFNPLSNERPQDVDEVRQMFFGDQADGFLKTASNVALTLLYDPLLFTGLLKGASALGKGGQAIASAGNILQKVVNPAETAIDAMRVASTQVLGPLAKTAAYRVLGAERAETFANTIMQNLVRRGYGVDEDLMAEVMKRDSNLFRWRDRTYQAISNSRALGGDEAQRLLSQALEADSVYARFSGDVLSRDQQRWLDTFDTRLERAGVDRDLFWQSYKEYRGIDDEIGTSLLEQGLIDSKQFNELRGTHLRRIYQLHENAAEYAKRIEDLHIPDVTVSFKAGLYEALNNFRADLGRWTRSATDATVDAKQVPLFGLGQTAGVRDVGQGGDALFGAARYIDETAEGRFNVRLFVDDLDEYVTKNSQLSINEVLAHVKDDMLAGATIPAPMWRELAENLTTTGIKRRRGSEYYSDMIRGWSNNPMVSWRTYQERLEVVAARENMPQEIREAMGEILEAAPRLASQTNEAGRLLETRRMFADLSGTKRINTEQMNVLQRAAQAGLDSTEGRALVEQVARQLELSVDELAPKLPSILEEGVGTKVGTFGTRWASLKPNQELGHTVRLPDTEGFGDMRGMWVKPQTAVLLRGMQGIDNLTNTNSKLWNKTGELLATLTSHFKMLKVVLDPTAQVRNLLGNAVLMDMSGTSPFRLDYIRGAVKELTDFARDGTMGKFMKLADEAGVNLFQRTFSKAELAQAAEQIARVSGDGKDWKGILGVFHKTLVQPGAKAVDIASRAFELNEGMFKMTVFMDRYQRLERGWVKAGKLLTPDVTQGFAKQAASIAEQALFNYQDIPFLVDFARKYGIVPFITFPFKAIPFVAETMYARPLRVLKYERLGDQLNAEFAGSSVDASREIEALPEHVRDALVLRLPFSDSQGRPQYLDLSYFLPWAVIGDLAKSARAGEGGGFREGVLTPPAMALVDALRYNKDSLGRPITDPKRSTAQNYQAIASYLWKFIAPPSFPGGTRADAIGRAMQAVATTDPQAHKWTGIVGRAWRGGPVFVEDDEKVLTASGFLPQSQGQMAAAEGPLGALGGFLAGVAMGGTSASDPAQAMSNTVAAYKANRAQAYQDIADIRSDPNLNITEKNKRIRRILDAMQQASQDTQARMSRLQ